MKRLFFIFLFASCLGLTAQNYQLKFETTGAATDSVLKNYAQQKSFKDYQSVKLFIEELSQSLQYEGYFNSRISLPVALNDSVYSVNVNLRNKYTTIVLKNIKDYSEVLQFIDESIAVKDLPQIINSLLTAYSDQGKPFTTIQFDDIEFNSNDTISANLIFNQSKERKLDKIVLKGYDRFPMSFLKNYANIKNGMTFNRNKLIQQSERLDLLQFVNQSKTPQVQFTRDSTKLFVYLEKQQANSFDGFIGFNNSEDNEFQLNGNLDLRLVNNFNSGEEINLNYKNDGNAQEWFDVGVKLPYLFNSKFSVGAGLGFFKQDSTFSNTTQQVKLDYQISSNINAGINLDFQSSSNLLDNDAVREDIQDFDKNRYGLSFVYDRPKRYSKLFLSSQQIAFNIGIGNRSSADIEESQQYFELNGRQIFKINTRQYVFTGLDVGYLNSDQYLSNELYRFGGINSIRGFVENRFFANLYGALQTEYRYILGSNLYVHSVLDYGFYENEIDRVSENLYSLGFGFGLETKAGILRLIFANGGSDSQDIEFANTQIHLKFISIF